ncbi:MAG: zinc-dependent metalloprotease [Flavobacteriaceae bacterium]|nr:zinc-dependent metalloprotease [Flavobacteriaceae bacterium]MBL6684675.1 zinc-dependent metalloprotease [Flavobacteriaceae bacterium]
MKIKSFISNLLFFAFTIFFSNEIFSQKKIDEKKLTQTKKYSEIITENAITDSGIFDVHKIDNKYYFEINDSLIGRDMMMVTRVVKMATEIPLSAHKLSEQVIKWEKFDNNILLRVASYSKFANDTLPINEAVSNSNFEPIISSFKIEAKNKEKSSFLIDVTTLFKSDIKVFGFPQSRRKSYKISSLDSKLSFIETIKSFPLNIEVRHIKTYKSSETRNGQISMLLNNSIILLPKNPMKKRYFDQRVGWITSRQIDYGLDNQEAETIRYLRRWRLEVKEEDIEKFKRGELVEPKNPIVFYVDPGTPIKWRKYIKQGIEDWQAAFEEAGFKNAIIAKDPPTKDEDPDWSPEDIRYSVFRYLASTTINANGGQVADPRSGEILQFDVNWYHNVLKLLRNWWVVQTGAVNPNARSIELKNEVMGEGVRFVAAHEVGHAIGLPHNMGSSSAYPVDSLRSKTFTKKFGTAPSIMDYARWNYVAQPGDEGVALMPSYWDTPNIGLYDKYSIKWGYKPILGVSAEEEKKILQGWILEKQDDLTYRYGDPGIDPSSQTEDLGDNAVKASEYGIANLKRIVPELINWSTVDGEDFNDLKEMYNTVLSQFRRYMGHVTNNVGGVYQFYKTSDQNGAVYSHVDKNHQKLCIKFLNTHLFETPDWIIEKNILDKIEFAGITNRIRSIQSSYLNSLLDFGRMARMIENEALNGTNAYTLSQMMNDLKKGLWKELYKKEKIDVYRRNLQRSYINRLGYLMKNQQEIRSGSYWSNYITPIKVDVSDVRSITMSVLVDLKKDILKYSKKYSDKNLKAHLNYCIELINNALITKTN